MDVCPLCTKSDATSWVQCDVCKQWYHTECVGLSTLEINNLHQYHCKKCSKIHGDSVYRRQLKRARVKIDYIALNEGETFAVDKSVHPHVHSFLQFEPQASRKASGHVEIITGAELTKEHALKTQLARPILVPNVVPEEAGMELPRPPAEITVDYITQQVGGDTAVEVMDVLSQQGVHPGWNMDQWNEYFHSDSDSRDRIRNVISLEVSDVDGLGRAFRRPKLVREMDLVDRVWCDPDQPRPKVTKYCLMSVQGSYTDFHLDFSGTCVYYTVCRGAKTFLMFPPTDDNLELYTQWCLEPDQNFMWFPEYTKTIRGKVRKPASGFRVTLEEKDLFIIPSGWIHAVHTPRDSVVIGGNYLLIASLDMHLKITEIEKVTRVPLKFRFPMLNKVLWMTSWYYLNHPDEYSKDTGEKREKTENKETGTNIKRETGSISKEIKEESVSSTTVKEEASTDETKTSKQELTISSSSQTLQKLLAHLKRHFELSKTNATARKSVPTPLIGKNVADYFDRFDAWAAQLGPTENR